MWLAALGLFFHMGKPMNKYHSYVLDDIQNSFPFSSGHMPQNRGFFHAQVPDTMHYLLMRLRDRLQYSARSGRKSCAQLGFRITPSYW